MYIQAAPFGHFLPLDSLHQPATRSTERRRDETCQWRKIMHDRPKRFLGIVRRIAVVSFLVALVSPESARSQPQPSPEELHAAAGLLFPIPNRHAEAAGLLRREADLRQSDDPLGVDALVLCGKLYYYVGELTLSRNALQDAAGRALAMGDVVRAAHAFVDASFIAGKQGRGRAVGELAGRARVLARSPLLTSGQRLAIEERVAGTIPVVHAGS